MRFLLQILRARRGLVLLYLLLGIMSIFLGAVAPVLLQGVLDAFEAGGLSVFAVLWYVGALGLRIVLEYIDNVPDVRLLNDFYLDLKLMALSKIARIDYRAYQTLGTGGLIQRIENGAAAGRGMVYGFWLRMLREILPGILFSLFFIDRIDRSIMLYIAIGYGVVFLVSNLLLKVLYRIKERILDGEELLQHYLVRGLTELVVFRTNRRFAREIQKAKASAGEITGAKVQIRMVHEAFFALFALLVVAIKGLILWISYRGGGLSVGAVVALLLLIDQAYAPIAIANVIYVDYKLDRSAYERLSGFLSLPDDPRLAEPERQQRLSALRGDYALESARVDYAGRLALDGVSLTIGAGGFVALVGESGSGKSTIAQLLAGLLRPDGGRILADRLDITGLNLDDYYRFVSYTGQDAPVFSGTLRENLAFDRPIPDDVLREALGLVQLEDFFLGLPEGFETKVGERGRGLSGGERQRLALARLFLTDPRVVILDEATSALDNETERLVMARLRERFAGRTLICIAHRLSTLREADHFFVMRGGQLVEQGNFQGLMDAGGYFAVLWQAALEREKEYQG